VTTVKVRGTITRDLPADYELHVFRVYSDETFFPLRKATISADGRSWEASSCEIGGKPCDRRHFAAYLVGPAGRALLEYHSAASRVHIPVARELAKHTRTEEINLPLIKTRTPDMVECARVLVQREAG